MKWTWLKIRQEAWRVLRDEVKVINIVSLKKGRIVARCEYTDDSITIWADDFETRLDHAVIHEIMHKVFDKHFDLFATYNVSEEWITAMEKPFFKKMTVRQKNKWRMAIKKKTIRRRE